MGQLILDRTKTVIIWIFLFTVPLFFLFDYPNLRLAQERYFQAAVMAFGALFLGNIWITLFIWLNLILFAVHGAVIGSSQILSMFLFGVLFAASRNYFSTHSFKKIVTALYLVAFITIVFMILQTLQIDFLHTKVDHMNKIILKEAFDLKGGMFSLPSFNSIFLTLIAALLLFLNSFWSWAGLLLFIAPIDARCSASFLAWSFLFPFWVWWRFKRFRRYFIPVIISVAMLFGFYTFKDFSGDKMTYLSRFESWFMELQYTSVNLLGWGPDSFRNFNKHKNFMFYVDKEYQPLIETMPDEKTAVFRYYSANNSDWDRRFLGKMPDMDKIAKWEEAHNDWLQYAFEYGLEGLAILFFFLKEIYDRFVLSDKTPEVLALFACIVVYALTATTQFPFHLARLSGIFGVILGAFFAFTDKQYQLIKGEYNA